MSPAPWLAITRFNMTNVCLIVQARMASERLPGKVLKTVLNKPLILHELERLKRVTSATRLVVATTTNPADRELEAFCKKFEVNYFRGSEADVLSRYADTARRERAETVVRVTADCPLIDPAVVDRTIRHFLDRKGGADYVSNVMKRTYPRGMDCEVFSAKALFEADAEAKKPSEREHVTPFFLVRPERYRLEGIEYKSDESKHRWTVDTPEDFELIRLLLEALLPTKPHFTLEDILEVAAKNPAWSRINRHIAQKTLEKSGEK